VDDRPGLIYAIENTVWPGWVKIGRAEGQRRDAEEVMRRRLYQYNTGDPHRAYTVVAEDYAACCHDAERFAHAFLEARSRRGGGEWFFESQKTAKDLIERACAIARLAPKPRAEQFARVVSEIRQAALEDTDDVLAEQQVSRSRPKKVSVDVAATARAARDVILALCDQQAMPDEKLDVAVQAVLRHLALLGDTA
jgi:hypothetical protein